MTLDMQKLEPLLGKMVTELGAASNSALVLIGDKLGLFKAIAERGPLTSPQLADATNTNERYVREWASAQAASGFIDFDAEDKTFSMTPEQAAVFADEDSPVNMTGGFHSLAAIFDSEPRLVQAFKSGKGVGWGDHCNCLFCGTERFFKPGYKAHLLNEWLPSLDGVTSRLQQGAVVADVGCGHGASTIIMADAFPKSRFVGVDFHEPSIKEAREQAQDRRNVAFEAGKAQTFGGGGYDLITVFDALHDMGDPIGAARNFRKQLKPDGTLMLIEPLAGDTLADNLHPVGRVYYAFSATICVPAALNQEGGMALGAQAGEGKLRQVLQEAGFSRVRRATETPFNMVLEVRP